MFVEQKDNPRIAFHSSNLFFRQSEQEEEGVMAVKVKPVGCKTLCNFGISILISCYFCWCIFYMGDFLCSN